MTLWLPNQLDLLRKMYCNCGVLRHEYHHAFLKYNKKYQKYKLPSMILSCLSTIMLLIGTSLIEPEYNIYVTTGVGVLTTIISFITGIEMMKGYDENRKKAFDAYLNVENLRDEIGKIFVLHKDVKDPQDVIEDVFKKYQQIKKDGPVLEKDKLLDVIDLDCDDIETLIQQTTISF